MKQTDVGLSTHAFYHLSSQSWKSISHSELAMLKLKWIPYLILRTVLIQDLSNIKINAHFLNAHAHSVPSVNCGAQCINDN